MLPLRRTYAPPSSSPKPCNHERDAAKYVHQWANGHDGFFASDSQIYTGIVSGHVPRDKLEPSVSRMTICLFSAVYLLAVKALTTSIFWIALLWFHLAKRARNDAGGAR